jgi:hypothetical protein
MPPASTASVPRSSGDVRRGVDAAGKTRGDDEALKPKLGRKLAREFLPDRGAVARADDCHDRAFGKIELSFGEDQRWRGVNLREGWRIAKLADREKVGA